MATVDVQAGKRETAGWSSRGDGLYRLYGLSVQSDIPLPLVDTIPDRLATPDIAVRRRNVPHLPVPSGVAVASLSCPVHGIDMIEYRGPGGIWIWLNTIAMFHLVPDASLIDVYPCDRSDGHTLGMALGGPVLLLARHLLGSPSLHASAVVLGHEAIAFLGRQRSGKSTMAAAFLRCGAALVTDDALPLVVRHDVVYALPGPAYMKLWRQTVHHTLGQQDDLPNVTADVDKKLLSLHGRYKVASDPVRLCTLYLLERYDPEAMDRTDITIRSLSKREALVALLANTSVRPYLTPTEDALALPVYTHLLARASVRVLTYPDGFDHQDAVWAAVIADAERR